MRPHPQPAGEPRLNRYRQIADRYLRYILIRALGVTNEPGIVQEIAVYALDCHLLFVGSGQAESGSGTRRGDDGQNRCERSEDK